MPLFILATSTDKRLYNWLDMKYISLYLVYLAQSKSNVKKNNTGTSDKDSDLSLIQSALLIAFTAQML